MNIEDTIVAISSPPGAAVRGIVRLSGPETITIAGQFFQPADQSQLSESPTPRYISGCLQLELGALPAAVYLFRAPQSYTRQDVVELHLLGSPVLLGILVETCLAAGARRAEPGEFTARAFLAGALDLSQVHGVAGMIAARSDHQLQAAERLLHGALSKTANHAREELADLLSLVEGALDFADEPIEFITPSELRRRLNEVREALASTTAAGLRAERWGQLPHVLLLGPPNVGKSSLMNRLSGLDRAICAPMAGTTRDVLSAPLDLGETECLLVDVAGLAMNDGTLESGRNDPHAPEAQAQRAARRARTEADLILHVVDLSLNNAIPSSDDHVQEDTPFIVVANKRDLLPDDQVAARLSAMPALRLGMPPVICPTSATTGEGCDLLKDLIRTALQDRPIHTDEPAIALMAEHRSALQDAINALDRALELVKVNQDATRETNNTLQDADLVAAELHIAADALAILVGKDQTEDRLGRIFARFCVGK